MSSRNIRPAYLYIGFVLAVLPLIIMRDFTPANELRYLSIADEALRNHTFFTFYNHGIPYADKPPLYLWIVMALRWILGSHQMWALALVSVVPALATVHMMDGWAAESAGGKERSAARMMLLTSAFFIGAAVTVRMDMLMCMFIVLSMRSFWHIYRRDGKYMRARWMFGIYVFMALFTKGPLGVLVPLGCTVAFMLLNRDTRRIAEVWGWRTWVVLGSGCAVWFGLVFAEGGTAYLDNLLFHQTVDRAVNAFHHNRPFHYYLVSMWYCVAPWSPLAVLAVCLPKPRRDSLQTFFGLSAIVTILLLSCVSSKLQIYMLPAIPFMAYTAAMSLPQIGGKWYAKTALAIPAAILSVTLVALVCAIKMSDKLADINIPAVYIAALALSAGGIGALHAIITNNGERPVLRAVSFMGTGMLVAVFAGSFALQNLNKNIGYAKLCRTVAWLSNETGIKKVAAYGMKNAEDMDVYLNRKVKTIDDASMLTGCLNDSYLLIMPDDKRGMVKGYTSYTVGNYAVVVGTFWSVMGKHGTLRTTAPRNKHDNANKQ